MSESRYSVFNRKRTDPTQQTENPSLYEKLGGAPAVGQAVDVFYRKVIRDARINYFFFGVNITEQAQKQKAFLSMAFGGPHEYTGRDMQKSHSRLVEMGMNDRHFNIVMDHLRDTLLELSVEKALVEEVLNIAESTREDVMGRSQKRNPEVVGGLSHSGQLVRTAPSFKMQPAPNTVGSIMNGSLISLSPEMPIQDAVAVFAQTQYSQLPVVNQGGQLMGILTANDLLKHWTN